MHGRGTEAEGLDSLESILHPSGATTTGSHINILRVRLQLLVPTNQGPPAGTWRMRMVTRRLLSQTGRQRTIATYVSPVAICWVAPDLRGPPRPGLVP